MIPDNITQDELMAIIEDLVEWEISEYNYEGLKEFFFYTQRTFFYSHPTELAEMLEYRKEYADGKYLNAPKDENGEAIPHDMTTFNDMHTGQYRPTDETYSKGFSYRKPPSIIDEEKE